MVNKLLMGASRFMISIEAAVIALVVFVFFSPECPGHRANRVKVKIYYADNISPAHQAVIDSFNARYAGQIQVVPINLPFSKFSTNERKELLARALRGKNSRVDVFAVDLIWVPRFARWAEPLDRQITVSQRDRILSYALESCYQEGRLVALPLYLDIGLMYYQRDLLHFLFPNAVDLEKKLRQSITWEEFVKFGMQVKSAHLPFFLYAGDNFEGLVCTFMELVLSQNPNFFDQEPLQLDAPETRKALQWLVDLVHKYKLTPLRIVEFDEYETYLFALRNKGVFWRGWPGLTVHFKDFAEFQERLPKLRIAALPHFKGSKPVSVFGGWNVMVSRHSKHKKEAMQFLHFLLQKQSQITLYKKGGYLPILKEVYSDSELLSRRPTLAYYHTLLRRGIHRPYRVDYTKWSDVISYFVHQAIKKELTVDQALTAAMDIIYSKKVLVR